MDSAFMIRLLGVVLVVSGAASFGIRRGVGLHRTAAQLRALCSAVELLQCEMNYTLLPLPELYRMTQKRVGGVVGAVFGSFAEGIENGETRERAARLALDRAGLELPNDALMTLLELLEGAGRYDIDGENRLLRLSAERLNKSLEHCERERLPLVKGYVILGICTGLAIVILMV